MRFVPVKSEADFAALVLHRARDFLVGQVTQTGNAIRAHMAEFGIVTAKGSKRVADLAEDLGALPEAARLPLRALFDQLAETQARIDRLTDDIEEVHRQNDVSRRLASIPGVGVLTATAIAATTPDVGHFSSARDYAAWLGLTPKQHSTGGKPRSGGISKMGNRYIRRLLYLGAMAQIMVRRRSRHPGNGLAVAEAGDQADQGRRDRAREPHGADDLRASARWNELPTASLGGMHPAESGLKEWSGQCEVMAN